MNDASSEQATCGTGFAAGAVLPKKLGVLMAAMADLLATMCDRCRQAMPTRIWSAAPMSV